MEKLFTVAGTSNLNGSVKLRLANDLKSRIKILERNGHTDIQLFELPRPMTKADAIAYLVNKSDIDARAAVEQLRSELEQDGEDTSTMTDEFLQEVVRREAA
jgi:hypothetical protein